MAIHRPVRLWRARPRAGTELRIALPPGSQGWLQMIEGSGICRGEGPASRSLVRGDGLGFPAGSARSFTTEADGTDLLLFELH
jgi:redox-sensitive bicupin YhaK (pirin superfamily)